MKPEDITIKGDQMHTALHVAVEFGHKDVVKILLDKNLPELVKATTTDGKTAYNLAITKGNTEIVELFENFSRSHQTSPRPS